MTYKIHIKNAHKKVGKPTTKQRDLLKYGKFHSRFPVGVWKHPHIYGAILIVFIVRYRATIFSLQLFSSEQPFEEGHTKIV